MGMLPIANGMGTRDTRQATCAATSRLSDLRLSHVGSACRMSLVACPKPPFSTPPRWRLPMRRSRGSATLPARGVPVGKWWRDGGDPRAAATRKMRVVPGRAAKMTASPCGGRAGVRPSRWEYGRNKLPGARQGQNVVRRGEGRVVRAAKAALRAAVVNAGRSASVQTRATSSRLCASELRVTA